MRRLLVLVLLAAAAWSGYWVIGSRALERGVADWFARMNAEGIIAERSSLAVQGFPNRFDLTIDAPRLHDPASGLGWEAPFVQLLTLSYRPWHVIAALPSGQRVTTPQDVLTLASEKLQASIRVVPGAALTLDELRVMGTGLDLVADSGSRLRIDEARFATRRTLPDGTSHEIGLDLLGVHPDPAWHAALPGLPETVEKFHFDAEAAFTAPLDRHSAETRPGLESLHLAALTLDWGQVALAGKGDIAVDASGRAEGRITLSFTNWRDLIPVAIAAGLVSAEVAPTWERALSLLAASSGSRDTLDLPLVFANGRMSLGPLPLGPAPLLR